MTIEECEKRNQSILNAFEEWKEGKNTLTLKEIRFLSTHFSLRVPKSIDSLILTESPQHANVYGPSTKKMKSIFNFLNELAEEK